MTLLKKHASLCFSLRCSSFKKSQAAFVALAVLFVYPSTSQGVAVNKNLADKPTTTTSSEPTPNIELINLTSKETSRNVEILTTSTPSTKEVAQILDVSPPPKTDLSQTVTTVKVTSTHKKKQIKKQRASNHDYEQRAQRKEASTIH